MAYVYPDKNDKMTMQLITGSYDPAYWGKSESALLESAREYIKKAALDSPIELLDIGCGQGRLFNEFLPVVDSIVAVEPDPSRFQDAVCTAKKLSEEGNKKPVRLENTTSDGLEALGLAKPYGVVLSSHVIQHIPCSMAAEMFVSIAKLLKEDGVAVMMCTFQNGDSDLFTKEAQDKKGVRTSTITDRDGFNKAFGGDSVLPVRMLSKKSIEEMAAAAGLEIAWFRAFHYEGHGSAEDDVFANLCCDYAKARDAFYILRKKH